MTPFYKIFIAGASLVLWFMMSEGCGSDTTKINLTMKKISTCNDLKSTDPLLFVEITGQLVQEPFVNKAGKPNYNIMEWYLMLSDGCRIYLKNFHSHNETMKMMKKRRVVMTGMIRYGQVDSDDPNVQSRIGHMLSVQSLREE